MATVTQNELNTLGPPQTGLQKSSPSISVRVDVQVQQNEEITVQTTAKVISANTIVADDKMELSEGQATPSMLSRLLCCFSFSSKEKKEEKKKLTMDIKKQSTPHMQTTGRMPKQSSVADFDAPLTKHTSHSSTNASGANSIITQVQKPGNSSNNSSQSSRAEPVDSDEEDNNNQNNSSTNNSSRSQYAARQDVYRNGISNTKTAEVVAKEYTHVLPAHDPRRNNTLLPMQLSIDSGKKTLVLDLDETLVHSSFKPVLGADFIVNVEIDRRIHTVYVSKRPHVDYFMQRVGQLFEVIVFTASLSKYADPVLDRLDIHRVVRGRLFREACSLYEGNYVKDMSILGRPLAKSLIIDNSRISYMLQPGNAVPVSSWFDNRNDTKLLELLPLLEQLAATDNIYSVLRSTDLSVFENDSPM